MNKIPLFMSDYSLDSVLKIKEAGKSKEGGADSIIDLCLKYNIKNPFFVEKTMSSVIDAYKQSKAAGLEMRFGYKVWACADDQDKTPESKSTESRVIVFIKNGTQGKGYYSLTKLHNYSTKNGFYDGRARISWNKLKEYWDDNLLLAIPFYNSFIHRNLLESAQCVPDFSFTNPYIFEETNNLPFDGLIKQGLDRLDKNFERVAVQSVYYKSAAEFESFLTYSCIQRRSILSKPNISHMGSKEFNLEKLFS